MEKKLKDKRVIELEVIDELEDSGVSSIALVDEPAIEKYWVYMRKQSFVKPSAGESESDFMGRCVPAMIDEGKPQDQAVAMCISMYDEKMTIDTSSLPPYVEQVPEKKNVKAAACPPATSDITINLANRQKAIDKAMYGPLDIKNPGDYWDKIAAKWKVPAEEAKGEICGNCAAFNITKALKDCIAAGIGEGAEDVIEAGDLGYCEFFDFKCNANRSCVAHVDGGPIIEEKFLEPNPCWDGYEAYGLKPDGTPNCIPIKSSKFGMIETKFATDNEKQVIVGPAMVPDMEIYRKDEDGEGYYVKFSAETIAKIQEKFMREMRNWNTNLEHDNEIEAKSFVMESWIVEDPSADKANKVYKLGVPKGSWMIKMKITSPEVWEAVKSGKYKGFSIEGNFIDKEELEKIDQNKNLLEQIMQILES